MKAIGAFLYLTLAGSLAAALAETNDFKTPPRLPPMPRYQQITDTVRLHELSPVAYFRVLLGMNPAQRQRALAEKSPAERDAILRKIAEYEAMPPAIREARLRQTQLRWTLVTLMKAPAAQRAERLRKVPKADQAWVSERIKQWDRLPAEEKKAYLEKQSFLSLYLRWQSASAAGQKAIVSALPPTTRAKWDAELPRWQALPANARQDISERFNQFFAMDDRARKETVSAMSDNERRQMEGSLRAFAQLPVEKRRQCVASFGKFATMSADEQGQFLRNAALWEEMKPDERHLWRQMAQTLPHMPPMPPGFYAVPPSGLPPMPPGFNQPPPPSPAFPRATSP